MLNSRQNKLSGALGVILRPFLVVSALVLSLLVTGCSPETPDGLNDRSAEVQLEPNSSDQEAEQSAQTHPLDLSRDAKSLQDLAIEGLDESAASLAEPDAALPDLFDQDQDQEAKRMSASGRVLMREDAGVNLEGVEGVELKIQMKTN